jgi:hypothetical protein
MRDRGIGRGSASGDPAPRRSVVCACGGRPGPEMSGGLRLDFTTHQADGRRSSILFDSRQASHRSERTRPILSLPARIGRNSLSSALPRPVSPAEHGLLRLPAVSPPGRCPTPGIAPHGARARSRGRDGRARPDPGLGARAAPGRRQAPGRRSRAPGRAAPLRNRKMRRSVSTQPPRPPCVPLARPPKSCSSSMPNCIECTH